MYKVLFKQTLLSPIKTVLDEINLRDGIEATHNANQANDGYYWLKPY